MNNNFKFFRGKTQQSEGGVLIMGGTRTLRARWTPEMAQDLQGYYSIDAEAELTRLLTEEINNVTLQNLFRLGGNRA